MYNQLQLENSLFVITEKELAQFKNVAYLHKIPGNIDTLLTHSVLDNWSVAFNIWCLFYEEKSLLLDSQKMMMYSSNFYCLQLLKTDQSIQRFLKLNKRPQTLFILSYYLAIELLVWVYHLLQQFKDGQILIEKNLNRDYFLLSTDQGLQSDSEHELYKEQKLVTSLMAQSYSTDDSFQNHLKQAIKKTREYLAAL